MYTARAAYVYFATGPLTKMNQTHTHLSLRFFREMTLPGKTWNSVPGVGHAKVSVEHTSKI